MSAVATYSYIQTENKFIDDIVMRIFNSVWDWTGSNETLRIIFYISILVIALLVALHFFFSALSKTLDGLVKLTDAYNASSLPRLMTREMKNKIRRRAQFCGVLEADLTYIAKAESWNDQYFTDLEAEVETEGGYYTSSLHRFIGKVSNGLRKEKSLINAISSSSERAIQLVGEPGSGKSVALRHLASQLAVKAKISKAKDILIPLYINLREINVASDAVITADTIRDFILDNIRRGDSDTTAYVRENWDDYRARGIWFFLFDSFDEIPAVLHAEKGSPAVNQYSEAIRKFLEGMGECRGILASREFKGPESLPWSKFRVLRLSTNKQHELVKNAFLSRSQERTVMHHLASNKSTLANTPLFLTLLCRYVKASSIAPKNDYELLSLQIDRLADRDPAYLKRSYGLSTRELLEGAQRIARLFAEESSLGLAPTIDQVESILDSLEIPGGDIQRFVAAMVDFKIARADVASATHGDRRFAFAHRRYQEALFVRHLVANPCYLSGYDLVTDPRWREYAVTLLETQPTNTLTYMFDAASQIIIKASATQRRREALGPLKNCCGYFEWSCDASQVLSLFQEGLSRRVADIPESLTSQIEKFLKLRWDTGDSFDRLRVMQVASLLPQATLCKYLEEVFSNGSEKAQNEAFKQTAALLGDITPEVQRAVLARLADEILGAKNTSAQLRVEALASRLPQSLGAEYVLNRCLILRRFTRGMTVLSFLEWPLKIVERINKELSPQNKLKNPATSSTLGALFIGGVIAFYLPLIISASVLQFPELIELPGRLQSTLFANSNELPIFGDKQNFMPSKKIIMLSSMLPSTFYLILPILFGLRAIGEPITIKFLYRHFGGVKVVAKALLFISISFILVISLVAIVNSLGFIVSFTAEHVFGVILSAPKAILGLGSFIIFGIGLMLKAWHASVSAKKASKNLFESQLVSTADPFRVLLLSKDINQFNLWLFLWSATSQRETEKGNMVEKLRSLSSALQHLQRGGALPKAVTMFRDKNPSLKSVASCITRLENINDNHIVKRTGEVNSLSLSSDQSLQAVGSD